VPAVAATTTSADRLALKNRLSIVLHLWGVGLLLMFTTRD
jgi:hypothetical protein